MNKLLKPSIFVEFKFCSEYRLIQYLIKFQNVYIIALRKHNINVVVL